MSKDSGLAKWPGYWRVDEIGEVIDGPHLGSKLTIYFSEVHPDSINTPHRKDSLTGKSRTLYRSAGALLIYTIGSVWKDGERVPIPVTAVNYDIHAVQGNFVKHNKSIESNGTTIKSVLPDRFFGLAHHSGRTGNALYKVIPAIDKNTLLIIPAAEIFRYFYGGSSRLLSAIMQGRLEEYVDWSACYQESRTVHLMLRRPLYREEMISIAPVLSSPDINIIHTPHRYLASCQLHRKLDPKDSSTSLVIKADFPFEGKSTLVVSGKPVLLAGGRGSAKSDTIWGYFVMEILHSSAALGFDFIDFTYENGTSHHKGNENPAENGVPILTPVFEEDEDPEFNDDPANANVKRPTLSVNVRMKQGIDRITFRRLEAKKNSEKHRTPGAKQDIEMDGLTFNEGNHTQAAKNNLGVDATTDQVPSVDAKLATFLNIVRHMRNTDSTRWTIQTLHHNSNMVVDGECVSQFPAGIGKRHTWQYIEMENETRRLRQVVWVEIEDLKTQRFGYIFEMELGRSDSGQCTLLMHRHDFQKIKAKSVKALLYLTAIKNRWPMPNCTWPKARQKAIAALLFDNAELIRVNHRPYKDAESQVTMRAEELAKILGKRLTPHPDEIKPK